MVDKGYADPLYSMDLLPAGSRAQAAVEVPEGLLVVRAPLLVRARQVSTLACYRALRAALATHEKGAAELGPFGLDEDWARSMGGWGERMLAWEGERGRYQGALVAAVPARRDLETRGRRLWRQLALSADLAGLSAVLRLGAVPDGAAALLDRLAGVAVDVGEPARAAQLQAFGFGPAQREELRRVLAAIGPGRHRERGATLARQRAAGSLLVVRGALIGDLSRLSRVAKEILLPHVARSLEMRRLLGGP